jgi:SAM-dependent methyltransferase
MDWTGGYVADIGYTAGFYRETAPSHLAFAALILGRSPGRALRPKRVLELGFGQGFGIALLAAANPDIQFEGYDFNPEHVAHARRLVEGAGLANLKVMETGFEEAAAQGGDNDLDVIAAHGIFSWVSRKAQDAIVAIIRQRLQPDGLIYISYNSMPGWAPLAPIRQFMLQVKRRHFSTSERQLSLALDLITKLKDANAGYFALNPIAGQHLQAMLGLDRVYLAHEYLDEHWDLFQFSDVVARLGEAKLTFVASATLPENLDQYAVQPALAPVLAETDDPVMRETLRDYASNKRFRRDVFARGAASLTGGEHRRMLSGLSFALAVPRDKVVFKFTGPLSELTGNEDFYRPVVDLLATKVATFDELMALPPFGQQQSVLLDCLSLLVHSGQVLPILPPTTDAEPSRRFNRMVIDYVKAGRFYTHLASPLARTGVQVTDIDLLALSALVEGEGNDPAAAARHALSILKSLGRLPVKDGKLLQDEAEGLAFLEERFAPVLTESVPVWRALGVV